MVYDYVMKQALRKQIGAVLSRLDAAEIARQSAGAAGVLRTLPAYRAARTIAFYMHMDTGELQTAAMIANAFEDGKRVFLPHIVRLQPGEAHPWFPSQRRTSGCSSCRASLPCTLWSPAGSTGCASPPRA